MHVTHEKGYLILAVNTDVDYVRCARLLSRSLKFWHPDSLVCLLTDQKIDNDNDFDIVKTLPYKNQATKDNPYANDWQCFFASPFRETIKLEADMLIAGDIDHWWTLLRNKELVISTGAVDYKNQPVVSTKYRRAFEANNLPDVYNAFTYWRLSAFSKDFFMEVKHIFSNWKTYTQKLKNMPPTPDTDLAYAIASTMLGVEHCVLPDTDYPHIVHMKSAIAQTPQEWYKSLTWEIDQGQVRVNGYTQSPLWHYHHKHLVKDFEPYYE